MDLNIYQAKARQTALYPNKDSNYIYPTLGLAGEAGELANKVKKISRDHADVLDESQKRDIAEELGDVLWYVSNLASELTMSLDEVAQRNLDKLASRKERGTLHGSGDHR
ncbi:MAG: nucleoside triphosphate pyrophosphohydrolase family protein [Patescibacteria group bacterium]|jgi:NTP pyrophosphatase (non-canonical NTP hydrolase)